MAVDKWWDETDVLSYLEVIPDYDEEHYSYEYNVERCGIHLRLTIAFYDAYVHFEIRRNPDVPPVFDFSLANCAGIRCINDKRGEYLEFLPGEVYGERVGNSNVFPYRTRLYAKSFIAVRFG
jgi:hypothetical protein